MGYRMNTVGNLLPEIWEKVFTHLEDDPGSLFNCSKTCSTWESILEKDKIFFLFPLAIPALEKCGALSKRELVECRLVCKRWRDGVDAHHLSEFPGLSRDTCINSTTPPRVWYNNDTLGVTLSCSQDLVKFTQDFQEGGNPPFFHGTIKMINERHNDPEFFPGVEAFLRSTPFQNSIRKLVYISTEGRTQCDLVLETVFLLKNLTSLAIIRHGDCNETGLDWMIKRRSLLPALPSLTSVNVYRNRAPQIADILLLSYSKQLKSLHVDFRVISWCPFFQSPAPAGSLENLEDLDVFDIFGNSCLLDRLLNFDLPRLRRLSLDYFEYGVEHQAFHSVVKILAKCSSTLEEIRLPKGLSESYVVLLGLPGLVHHPRVKILTVTLHLLACPWRNCFLSKFPNLQTLKIVNYDAFFSSGNTRKDLVETIRKQTSHVWNIIPSLDKIVVEGPHIEAVTIYKVK